MPLLVLMRLLDVSARRSLRAQEAKKKAPSFLFPIKRGLLLAQKQDD